MNVTVVINPGAIKTDLISVDSNQILGIKLQKSCKHVRAYGPHNILWRAACGPRAVVCQPLILFKAPSSIFNYQTNNF